MPFHPPVSRCGGEFLEKSLLQVFDRNPKPGTLPNAPASPRPTPSTSHNAAARPVSRPVTPVGSFTASVRSNFPSFIFGRFTLHLEGPHHPSPPSFIGAVGIPFIYTTTCTPMLNATRVSWAVCGARASLSHHILQRPNQKTFTIVCSPSHAPPTTTRPPSQHRARHPA